MTEAFTLETLSTMTMVQIINKMNKMQKTIRILDADAHKDIQTINYLKKENKKLMVAKPKKTRIKGTKKELVGYLDRTEEELLLVLHNVWNFSNLEAMEYIMDSYETSEYPFRPQLLKDMNDMIHRCTHCSGGLRAVPFPNDL
tara:strand:- start:478 stop:906 length:429 start_codon:yes stop_codon:yes gene_type:complete